MQTDVSAEELVPIREVARRTGVNTVTLRAWERRYGLLKPTRTGKGHRLYGESDIERVRDIQTWLARGVAVGKIRGILAASPPVLSASEDGAWDALAAQLAEAVMRLDLAKLERQLAEMTSLYPMPLLADRLFEPLLGGLQQSNYGAASRRALLQTLLCEQLYSGQSRLRQTARGPRVVVVRLSDDDNACLPLMLVNGLLVNGYQAHYMEYVPAQELIYVAEQLQADGVVLYGDSAASLMQLHTQLDEWQQMLSVPLFLYGPVVALAQRSPGAIGGKAPCAAGQQDLLQMIGSRLADDAGPVEARALAEP